MLIPSKLSSLASALPSGPWFATLASYPLRSQTQLFSYFAGMHLFTLYVWLIVRLLQTVEVRL